MDSVNDREKPSPCGRRSVVLRPWTRRLLRVLLAFALACIVPTQSPASSESEYTALRQVMVREVEAFADFAGAPLNGALDAEVMAAMAKVPRHAFLPRRQKPYAYENRPLPIGYGQTISQPYIVALMTELLRVDSDDVVLEIGTGSGYQAAILAELVRQVYTIEIIPGLGTAAKQRLEGQDYNNVTTTIGDGYYGWQEHAPFDGIIVTAAATSIPPPLIKQLKPGGRMVIPVGGVFSTQQLMLVEKDPEGRVHTRQLLPVRFVPLTGERGPASGSK